MRSTIQRQNINIHRDFLLGVRDTREELDCLADALLQCSGIGESKTTEPVVGHYVRKLVHYWRVNALNVNVVNLHADNLDDLSNC